MNFACRFHVHDVHFKCVTIEFNSIGIVFRHPVIFSLFCPYQSDFLSQCGADADVDLARDAEASKINLVLENDRV